MNNSDSPKPSEPRPRWQRWVLEGAVALLILTAATLWLTRDMLARQSAAPPLNLVTLQGADYPLQWPTQQRRTLVYFFAPWCSVCRISMPGLNLLEADDDALTVIAVALDWESVEEVETFITDSGFSGPVLLGHAQTGRDYQISGYPSYYIISQDGQIEHADRGLSTPPGLWLRSRL